MAKFVRIRTEVDLDIVHPYIKEMLILDPRCQVAASEPYRSLALFVKVASVQEVFHVYLNKFENAVTHLFFVILGNY